MLIVDGLDSQLVLLISNFCLCLAEYCQIEEIK